MHGFDEFWGYRITSMRWRIHSIATTPRLFWDKVGPRNLVHAGASDVDDPTGPPASGKCKQKVTDEGPLPPHPMPNIRYNMETVDEVIYRETRRWSLSIRQNRRTSLFLPCGSTPLPYLHVVTHLSEKYDFMPTPGAITAGASRKPAWLRLGPCRGRGPGASQRQRVLDNNNTIVIFTTDNGAENFT